MIFFWNLDLFSYGKWREPGAETIDYDWYSVHNGPTTARTRQNSNVWWLWMLGEEEGLSGDLTSCSLGQRSDG
jgi:hypothetical protein